MGEIDRRDVEKEGTWSGPGARELGASGLGASGLGADPLDPGRGKARRDALRRWTGLD